MSRLDNDNRSPLLDDPTARDSPVRCEANYGTVSQLINSSQENTPQANQSQRQQFRNRSNNNSSLSAPGMLQFPSDISLPDLASGATTTTTRVDNQQSASLHHHPPAAAVVFTTAAVDGNNNNNNNDVISQSTPTPPALSHAPQGFANNSSSNHNFSHEGQIQSSSPSSSSPTPVRVYRQEVQQHGNNFQQQQQAGGGASAATRRESNTLNDGRRDIGGVLLHLGDSPDSASAPRGSSHSSSSVDRSPSTQPGDASALVEGAAVAILEAEANNNNVGDYKEFNNQQDQEEDNSNNNGEEEIIDDDGSDVPDSPLEHHVRVNELYRRAIFATIPVFMAYAGMITLQRSIKNRIGITDKDKKESDLFGVAVGSLYLGNLIFRLLHNVLFSFMSPRQRVMLSYVLLASTHLLIGVAYWVFDSKSLVWTFMAYLLSGVGIGTFESNLLSCLSPLGHGTKSWAVLGIPIGFNGVSVGFYIIFAVWPGEPILHAFPYFLIAASNLFGLMFWCCGLPHVEHAGSNQSVATFKEDLALWRQWLPRIDRHCISLAIDMFCVSLFSAIVYYIYNLDNIPLWPYADKTIPKNIFQTWYNFMSFLGDFCGRKVAYSDRHKRNPYWFLLFSLVGGVLVFSKTALLAPIGMGCVMFANGSIYAHTTKHVDNVVDDRFILIALSFWLFSGDILSYAASLIVQPLQIWIGEVPVHQVLANVTNMTNATGGMNWTTKLPFF